MDQDQLKEPEILPMGPNNDVYHFFLFIKLNRREKFLILNQQIRRESQRRKIKD